MTTTTLKRLYATALAAALAASASLLAQGPQRDGNWQVTMEMEMAGMPQKMPPMTFTHCVTKEEANDPSKLMPQGRGKAPENCKITEQKTVGNTFSWSMACAPPNEMTGTGEVVYASGTYTGVMKMTSNGQNMIMKYSGKRLGDCTK